MSRLLKAFAVVTTMLALSIAASAPVHAGEYGNHHYRQHDGAGGYHHKGRRHHGHVGHNRAHRQHRGYDRGYGGAHIGPRTVVGPPRRWAAPRPCHPVSKVAYRHGRGVRVGGTMCYDAYGNAYIVKGSRWLGDFR